MASSDEPIQNNQSRQKRSSKKHTQKRNDQVQVQKRRPYRPGYNSYLKVDLEDSFVDRIYSMALDVQNAIAAQHQEPSHQDVHSDMNGIIIEDGQNTPKKQTEHQPEKTLRFKPRSRRSLHMTLFFGGEVLGEIPAHELQAWYDKISHCIKSSGFCTHQVTDAGKDEREDDNKPDFSFVQTGLIVFPPNRQNLVVASLKPGPEWFKLHDEIHEVSLDRSISKELSQATGRTAKGKWLCHITLGNLIGGNKKQDPMLASCLNRVFQKHSKDLRSPKTQPLMISMGGPIPEQIPDLDWKFEYHR